MNPNAHTDYIAQAVIDTMKTRTIEPMALSFRNPTNLDFQTFRICPKHHPFFSMGLTNEYFRLLRRLGDHLRDKLDTVSCAT